MGKFDNLNDGQLPEILRRLDKLERATPMNNAAIGRGGFEVYDGGTINVSSGNLIVNGTATISGVLNADGTVTLSGTVGISGPLTISGATDITGDTDIAGDLTVTGPTKLNGKTDVAGNTKVTGTFDVVGPMTATGTLSIEGATDLKNNLTVAAGKKITVGGLTLENTGENGGQVNFPGGSVTGSSFLGMAVTHTATVDLAGGTRADLSTSGGGLVSTKTTETRLAFGSRTFVLNGSGTFFSGLPTTTNPGNLYVSPTTGQVFRSTV